MLRTKLDWCTDLYVVCFVCVSCLAFGVKMDHHVPFHNTDTPILQLHSFFNPGRVYPKKRIKNTSSLLVMTL
jgi:hypothetical protein